MAPIENPFVATGAANVAIGVIAAIRSGDMAAIALELPHEGLPALRVPRRVSLRSLSRERS